MNRFSWTDHLELALLSLVFGHAFFEQEYEYVDRMYQLKKLEYRPPRTIAHIEVARDGGLEYIEQFPETPGVDLKINVDRLVGYTNGKEGGNWTGVSILRPAFAAWYLKTKALRTQAQSFERNGLGVPVYTGSEQPEGLSPEEIMEREDAELEEGEKLAQAYRGGETAGAAIPYKAKLELLGVKGTLPDMDKGIRLYNEEIARAVLANFLSLGQETGSWALGETFENFFTLSLQTIARSIAETATKHIVEDLVDHNFSTDEPAPRVTFDEIGSRHPATAEAIMALVQCGALVPDEQLEDYLRNMYALPKIDTATRRLPTPGAGTQESGDGQQNDPANNQEVTADDNSG
jgi:phage gp29-like protein